jgi:hypothetical protein
MPKQLPTDLLDRVSALLHEAPKGLTLADIENSLRGIVSRRSLQRRLDQWTRKNAIRAEGVRRGRRYFSATAHEPHAITPATGTLNVQGRMPEVRSGIPISSAGEEIQAFVRKPLADRPPVGYQSSFLENYIPN